MSRVIGAVISSGKATMQALDESLSVEDAYDLLEIMAIDAYNFQLLHPKTED